jgi:hypothetical protein
MIGRARRVQVSKRTFLGSRRYHIVPRMRRLVLSTIALGLLVACSVKGDVAGAFLCAESMECPDGMSCRTGVCTADGEPDGGPMGEGPCSTTDQLATTFDGTTPPIWMSENPYVPNGGTINYANGEMVMTVPANTDGARAVINSYAALDLRGRSLEFEVTQVGGATTEVGLLDPSDADVFFGMTEGNMFIHSKGRYLTRNTPYSAVNHRWWRVRDEGGVMIWDTSPDRSRWTELGRDSAPLNAAYVQVEFGLYGGANTPAGTARWASISPGTDATPRWCKLSSFPETLTDGVLAPTTGWYGNGCTASEENGKLKLVGNEHDKNCVIYSTRPVDARDATYAMEVNASPYPGGTRIGFADYNYRNYITMEAKERLEIFVEANDRDVLNYSANRDDAKKFWRIVFAGATIRFERSADSVEWETVTQLSEPTFEASALFLERSMYVEPAGPLPATSTFGALIR